MAFNDIDCQEVQFSAQVSCLVALLLGNEMFVTAVPLPAPGAATFLDAAAPATVAGFMELDVDANTTTVRAMLNIYVLFSCAFNIASSCRVCLEHYRKGQAGYKAATEAERSTGRGPQAFWTQTFAIFFWGGLLVYAWLAADTAGRVGGDPHAYTLWFLCATWCFADLQNHLLVLRVAKMPFPSLERTRSTWIMGTFVAVTEFDNLYPGALPGGTRGGMLGRLVCVVVAVASHMYYSVTVGRAIAEGLGVSFFVVPADKQAAARAKGM
jgi:hypothetical protein